MGCVDKTVIGDTSLSLGSLLTDGTMVEMVHIEAILLFATVAEKRLQSLQSRTVALRSFLYLEQ